jgi:hypothetical protein
MTFLQPRILPAGVARCPVQNLQRKVYRRHRDAKQEVAMLYALLALMAPLWSDTRVSSAGQRDEAEASASRLLLFAAITLFLILSILCADLHREDLRALGLVGTSPTVDSIFLSP